MALILHRSIETRISDEQNSHSYLGQANPIFLHLNFLNKQKVWFSFTLFLIIKSGEFKEKSSANGDLFKPCEWRTINFNRCFLLVLEFIKATAFVGEGRSKHLRLGLNTGLYILNRGSPRAVFSIRICIIKKI